ncbi:S46 family peptidase [Sorangium sp. So ce1504]|uniref:S46 family peptidase n=1 Tax=Sorangium sp. So ce1504 TaxID=3133337 RepID=UPI003F610D9B
MPEAPERRGAGTADAGPPWLFMPSITRTIHVDHRYMEWVMDAVSGADAVLKEMGGKPAID